MGLGLFLIPVLGGYLFVTTFNGFRDRAARESGYHVFLRSALVGVVLVVPARGIAIGLDHLLPGSAAMWKSAFPMDFSGTAAIAVLLGLAFPHVLNLWVGSEDARRKTAREMGDHIGLVFDEAMDDSRFVEVSLTSGKSYVGVPLARTFLAREGGDIVLIPLFSGYRAEETRDLVLTVNYAPVLEQKRQAGALQVEDFRVAVPLKEVLSARIFDMGAFAAFAEKAGGVNTGGSALSSID